MTRRLRPLVMLTLTGCGSLAMLTPISGDVAGQIPIAGGLADQRPYFGTATDAFTGRASDFLLATCGCGSWRVLFKSADGSQWQFPVHFYTPDGTDSSNATVTVFGTDEQDSTISLLATLDQPTGRLDGRSDRTFTRLRLAADRRETHANDAASCVACHVGENPIFPQPERHPAFRLDPPNCLDCHSVVISK